MLGSIITNLIQLPLSKHLIESKVMIKALLISIVWFLIFVGISHTTYHLLGKVKVKK